MISGKYILDYLHWQERPHVAPAHFHARCFSWGSLNVRCALTSELRTWHRGFKRHCCAICFPWGCRTDLIVPFQGAWLRDQECCLVTCISSLIVLHWAKGKCFSTLLLLVLCDRASLSPSECRGYSVVLRVSCSVLNFASPKSVELEQFSTKISATTHWRGGWTLSILSQVSAYAAVTGLDKCLNPNHWVGLCNID